MHPDNFGRVTINDVTNKWKLFDFRVEGYSHLYLNPNVFEGFKAGNGIFNYDYADFLKDTFRASESDERKMVMACQVMDELRVGRNSCCKLLRKMPLLDAMEKAYNEICAYISQNSDLLKIDLDKCLEDLRQYFDAVKVNLDVLSEGIHVDYKIIEADQEQCATFGF